jgi:hypothetical protein
MGWKGINVAFPLTQNSKWMWGFEGFKVFSFVFFFPKKKPTQQDNHAG